MINSFPFTINTHRIKESIMKIILPTLTISLVNSDDDALSSTTFTTPGINTPVNAEPMD